MPSLRLAALAIALVATSGLQAQKHQAPPAPPVPPVPPVPAVPESEDWAQSGRHMAGVTRVERRTEYLKAGSKLWVRNRNGSIVVNGWDKDTVDLVAEIRETGKRKVDLVLQRKPDGLDIEATFQQPSSWGFSFFGVHSSPKCEMTLNVPRKVLAYFRTTNGSVRASYLDGYARCESTNGDILVQDISGEVHAETTNGTLRAARLRARLKGETTNGRIQIEDVEGGLRLETTNGSISARNLDGWGEGIRLEAVNGGIDVELGKATGEILAENSNGGLDIHVPGAQVVEIGKHRADLKLPGKNQKISIETVNGSIRVR